MAIRRTKRGFVLTDEHAHDYVRMVANDTGSSRDETKATQAEPYTPEILLLRLVQDMERIGTETVWLSRARDHLRRTGYSS